MVPMAPGSLRHCLLLAALFLLLGASQAAAAAAAAGCGGVRKVRVELYYESMCPYSARFVVNRIAKVFEDGLVDAADLKLVPYGNTGVGKDGALSCQHGPDECLLNTVEACAIDVWPDLNVHFSFINCVEGLVMKRMHREWRSCFAKLGLDTKPFSKCYESERGHKLLLKFGKETDALVPPHRYVPWVVVDGQPLYDDYENFEAYVCKAYKGTAPPKVCQGLVHRPQIVQVVVEAGGAATYNSGDNDDLWRGVADDDDDSVVEDDKIKMVLPDDDN